MSNVGESMTSPNHYKYQEITLICCTDADYLSNHRNVVSQTGFIFYTVETVILWISTKVDESMTSSNHTKYQEITLICYTDAGYLSNLRNVMSQTGFIFLYSRNVISWISTKHTIIVTFPIYTLK